MLKILSTIILFTSIGVSTVSAASVEVDLTQFASGDATTHSHVYIQQYDSSRHWMECRMCGKIVEDEAHDIQISYTIAENTCNENNKKLSACSKCNYSTSQKWCTLSHTLGSYSIDNKRNYDPSEPLVYVAYKTCSECISRYGATEPVYNSNGEVVDRIQSVPMQIYTPQGSPVVITSITLPEKSATHLYHTYNIEYNFDYSEATITSVTTVPEAMLECGATCRNRMYVHSLDISAPTSGKYFYDNSAVYDATNNTYTSKWAISVRDWTDDTLDKVRLFATPIYTYVQDGITYTQAYNFYSKYYTMNFADPTISVVEIVD